MERLFTMATLVALMLGTWTPSADAQSAGERRAAGNAYNRASAAYLAEDWTGAARWFETAHRLAPNPAALTQAVRAHKLAGNDLRAATLSLRILASYEDDEQAATTARQILTGSRGRFVRVDVTCEECTVELDGTVQEHPSFFVTPGEAHQVTASFSTGPVTQSVRGPRGARRELSFEAPEEAEPVVSDEVDDPAEVDDEAAAAAAAAAAAQQDDPNTHRQQPTQDAGDSSGLSPIWFIGSAVLTAGAGAFLVWSAVDALDGVEAYEADPTPQRLADGQNRELRTNIMIGVTAGLGALTVALLVFTDWSGGDEESMEYGLAPLPGGAAASLRGHF